MASDSLQAVSGWSQPALEGLHKHCREEMAILAGFLPARFKEAMG